MEGGHADRRRARRAQRRLFGAELVAAREHVAAATAHREAVVIVVTPDQLATSIAPRRVVGRAAVAHGGVKEDVVSRHEKGAEFCVFGGGRHRGENIARNFCPARAEVSRMKYPQTALLRDPTGRRSTHAPRSAPVRALLAGGRLLLWILKGALFGWWMGLVAGCASRPPLPPQAIELNRLGAEALATGDFETAAARIALAIEYAPRFTEAWVNLGLLQLQTGEREAARRTLRKARDLNPNLPAPHHALGLYAEAQDDGPAAEREYRAALKVDPGFAPARANLARLLFRRAAWDDAREQLLRLTEAAPDAIEGWTGLVETYLRLGRDEDADLVLARATERFGERPELVLLAARAEIRKGELGRAEAMLAPLTTRSQASAKERATALGFLAVARLGRGEVARARTTAGAALALDAENDVARFVAQKLAE